MADFQKVRVADGDVGQGSGLEPPLTVFLEGGPGGVGGGGLDRLLDGQPLVREPAFLRLALQGLAR